MKSMDQAITLLTNPRTGVKRVNPGYPGIIGGDDIASILDTRVGDKFTPEQAYVMSSWFRRCVDVRADALATIPYTIRSESDEVLYDSSGFKRVPPELMWLSDLETLLKLTESSLIVSGAAYMVPKVRGGRPRKIDWVSPLLMEPEYNEQGDIYQYVRTRYQPNGSTVVPIETRIPARFVVALFQRDPFTEIGPGNTVADAARVNADVLHSLDTFLDQYMDRGLLPASLITVPANTPPEERNRFQQWWDRYYRGKYRAGTQKVLNADAVNVVKLGDGIGQLGASEIVREQREAIAAAIGVPMRRLIPSSESGGAASKEDEVWYTNTIIPDAKRLAIDINRNLMSEHGLYFRFEYKRIEALQRANLETARGVQRLVEKPVLTQNEGRAIIGYEPVDDEGADELYEEPESRLSNDASTLAVQEASTNPENRPMAQAVEEEVAKWYKKAAKKGRDIEFNCEEIPPMVEGEIRRRLRLGEDLKAVFSPPFVQF